MSPEMQTRSMGSTAIEASVVGLGTWAIGGWMWGGTDEAESVAAIRASLDEGVSLIDTAPAYGQGRAEEIVGKAIKGRRDEVVLTTKYGLVWHTRQGNHFFDYDGRPVHRYLGKESIVYEVEQSLQRLGTDHIDHYITHWQDPTTPIEETVEALVMLRDQGKIGSIGASNVSGDALRAYAATVAQVVIACTVHQPGITFALCGARNPDQARENAGAGRIRLSTDEVSTIDDAVTTHLTDLDA